MNETLLPQPGAAPSLDPGDFCGVEWGLIGRVASRRGVQLVATNGMPNGRAFNHITSVKSVLGYSFRMPADVAIGQHGRSFQSVGPLNFYSPGASFTLRSSGPMTMAMCFMDPGFLASLAEREDGIRLGNLDLLPNIESERLIWLGREMFREAIEPGFAGALFAEAIGMAIVLEIARLDGARRSFDAPRRGGLAPWQLRRLESYVRDHLSEELTLDELALMLGISVRHLSRTVREAKGMGVHRWIAEWRIKEARRQLTETNLPIHEIARRSGFQNAAAFSTAFRTACGFAPGEFRRFIAEGR